MRGDGQALVDPANDRVGEAFDVQYQPPASEEAGSGVDVDIEKPVTGDEKQDLAYTSSAIGMHTDNPYRYPTPDYQLLHAIEHCSCEGSANRTAGAVNCPECSVINYFADGPFVHGCGLLATPRCVYGRMASHVGSQFLFLRL